MVYYGDACYRMESVAIIHKYSQISPPLSDMEPKKITDSIRFRRNQERDF